MTGAYDDMILSGCYYPGCEDEHAMDERFCPNHGGKFTAHAIDGVVVKRKEKR